MSRSTGVSPSAAIRALTERAGAATARAGGVVRRAVRGAGRAGETLRRKLFCEAATRRRQLYLTQAARPVHSLLFLLPWVALYEGWAWSATHGGGAQRLVAHTALRNVFEWLGIVGFWVPAVVLVVALLVAQRHRREGWQVRAYVLPLMYVESALLALPLLIAAGLFAAPVSFAGGSPGGRAMLAVGAGIYEELVFRCLLIAGLLWLARELANVRGERALALTALLAALVFALCHFEPVGADPFQWTSFWFRLCAGIYLGVVYLGRGLGIAAGAHAVFNAVLVLVR